VLYGQHVNIQGTEYVTGPRNMLLVGATMIDDDLNVVPGTSQLRTVMRKRCGTRRPNSAWAFVFHFQMNIVPDYVPTFVTRTDKGWYVF
jgi:hypothetical protein